jgi:hypothetical protein
MKFPVNALIGDRSGLGPASGKKQVFTIGPICMNVDGKDLPDLTAVFLKGVAL